jgi:hypothetical protein
MKRQMHEFKLGPLVKTIGQHWKQQSSVWTQRLVAKIAHSTSQLIL